MTAQPLSAAAFVSLLDRIEAGGAAPGPHSLTADDAAHLAFAEALLRLRARPAAPDQPPWERGTDAVHAVAGAGVGVGVGVEGRAPVLRGPRRRHKPVADPRAERWLPVDALALTALLVAIVAGSWQALSTFEPQRRAPGTPTSASQPAVVPATQINSVVSDVSDGTAEATASPRPSGTSSPTQSSAGYPPPAAPSTAPGTATAVATAAPDDDRARRERTAVTPQAAATDLPPYPGPATVAAPEPRITRIGPQPVPTTAPTPAPTAPATPSQRPLPSTPTLPPPVPTLPGGAIASPRPSASPSNLDRRNP